MSYVTFEKVYLLTFQQIYFFNIEKITRCQLFVNSVEENNY